MKAAFNVKDTIAALHSHCERQLSTSSNQVSLSIRGARELLCAQCCQ